jgi:hypothetical protein
VPITHRRHVWAAVIAAAAVTAGLVAFAIATHHQSAPSDCQIVRNLTAYNKSQEKAIANAFNPDQDHEASVSEYQQWADHIRGDAARIRAADLAAHAQRLADDATKLVELVRQARSDTTAPADPDATPPWAQPYADLGKQFHNELEALNRACPG